MKKILTIITAGILIAGLAACSKDNSSSTPVTVPDSFSSGSWRITYFWDTDHEETSTFSGYSFTFNDNGAVTAENGKSFVTGTWSTKTDDSTPKLVISFTTPSDFQSLSSDWKILESTPAKIRLSDVSGGNGGTDYLTFEKN